MIQDKIEDMLREIWEEGKVPSKIVVSHDTLNKWEEESGIPFILKSETLEKWEKEAGIPFTLKSGNVFLSSGWQDIPIEADDKIENEIVIYNKGVVKI